MGFLKSYGLGITLFLLFVVSWLLHGVFEYQQFVQEQQDHGQPVQMSKYWITFFSSTFENWQSEFLQLFTMVVLTAFLIHKGSAESRDSNDRMEAVLQRIEKKLNAKKS